MMKKNLVRILSISLVMVAAAMVLPHTDALKPAAVMAADAGSTAKAGTTYTVKVKTGYLALRSAQAYDYKNEIGKLYTGQTVQVLNTGSSGSTYWWVYAPTLDQSGYVNKNYLTDPTSVYVYTNKYTVKLTDGYLNLRSAKAYDYRNVIGRLYNGETVDVTDSSDPSFWKVYVPSLGKSGYVHKNYLSAAGSKTSSETGTTGSTTPAGTGTTGSTATAGTGTTSGVTKTVKVKTGYLALRSAQAYDYKNEIGKLYTGQTVQVVNTGTSGSTYWWVYAPSLGKSGYVNKNYLF